MNEQIYNRYMALINKRYKYDNSNMRLYSLKLKLMSWCYNQH